MQCQASKLVRRRGDKYLEKEGRIMLRICALFKEGREHRVHRVAMTTFWRIMMVKSAQPGEGGDGERPPPFTLSTI
jgi:hypothetical protein